jgi:hypothetical protein
MTTVFAETVVLAYNCLEASHFLSISSTHAEGDSADLQLISTCSVTPHVHRLLQVPKRVSVRSEVQTPKAENRLLHNTTRGLCATSVAELSSAAIASGRPRQLGRVGNERYAPWSTRTVCRSNCEQLSLTYC